MSQPQVTRIERPGGSQRLGEILVAHGVLTRAGLDRALQRQRASASRLGEILCADGAARPGDVAAALAAQRSLRFVDLDATPPDADLLRVSDLVNCLQRRAIPWRRLSGALVIAAADPDALDGAEALLRRAFRVPAHEAIVIAACAPEALDRHLSERFPQELARRAASRTPRRLSARGLAGPWARLALAAGLLLAGGLLAAAPGAAIPALFVAALLVNVVNVALRLTMMAMPAAATHLPHPRRDGPAPDGPPPRISVLIALYREPAMAAPLIEGLRALDYPPERMEVLLALEADDAQTAEAIRAAAPPPWIRTIVTPPGGPRTKPRALNHALDFARGEIIGVYDAEDRPAPDQLRKVAAAFAGASGKLACVQARLAFRNEDDGWIPRCFAVEYATWFSVMLPGLARIGAPMPLGGTSVFFRRMALERIGAWDAHNVTEDADLGVRLARAGYATGLIDSETAEEATRTPLAWIRQRSRWQKGYLITWLTHMRAPRRLWRDLGPRGFLGFQAHFIGAASAFLAQPLFWAIWALPQAAGGILDAPPLRGPLGAALLGALLIGQGVVVASCLLGLRRSGREGLRLTALSLPLYWPLGAISAMKSLAETAIAPMYWDKTEHGPLRRGARRRPRKRLARRSA